MQIGYFGVIIPQHDYYQGYFLDDQLASEAQATLGRMRVDPEFSWAITAARSPHTYSDDLTTNQMISAVSASIVDTALKHQHAYVGILGYVMSLLIKQHYFTITHLPDAPPKEIHTKLADLSATTSEAARSEIDRLPAVLAIKLRLWQQLDKHICSLRKH